MSQIVQEKDGQSSADRKREKRDVTVGDGKGKGDYRQTEDFAIMD